MSLCASLPCVFLFIPPPNFFSACLLRSVYVPVTVTVTVTVSLCLCLSARICLVFCSCISICVLFLFPQSPSSSQFLPVSVCLSLLRPYFKSLSNILPFSIALSIHVTVNPRERRWVYTVTTAHMSRYLRLCVCFPVCLSACPPVCIFSFPLLYSLVTHSLRGRAILMPVQEEFTLSQLQQHDERKTLTSLSLLFW